MRRSGAAALGRLFEARLANGAKHYALHLFFAQLNTLRRKNAHERRRKLTAQIGHPLRPLT